MALDQQLVEDIKANFARKSSGQLQAIAMLENVESWSPEAIEAARELLEDRRSRRAQEPPQPEEDLRAPPRPVDPTILAFWATFALFGAPGSILIRPVLQAIQEGRRDSDVPIPFGQDMAWLALDTTDTDEVSAALGLAEVRPATWADGIAAANDAAVFISPPLGDWTLVASTALFVRQHVGAAIKLLLVGLSRRFRDAQYFCTHRDDELHIWARARQGQFVRGYGWDGKKRLTLWDEGKQTKEERDLGFEFFNPDSFSASPMPATNGQQVPDEACVMQLASLWSIDPSTLDESFKEPTSGLLGTTGFGK